MQAFCTLFDSNYLDKGIALYRSLSRVMDRFQLYILPMDELCKNILMQMSLQNVTIIPQEDFEDDELKAIRLMRTRAEYCWTCTASLLDYVLENYNVEYCTYLDSDLYFFQSPYLLLDELYQSDCSVQIVEHRFGKGIKAEKKEEQAGKYCVQFNTFKNDENGRHVLKIWKEQCRAHCSMQDGEMGDQKYLSRWTIEYDCVQELQNHGGGVAPWNIGRYQFVNDDNQIITIRGKDTCQNYPLVFYHFHCLEYRDDCTVDMHIYKSHLSIDKELVKRIYYPYLKEIEEIKNNLNDAYGFRPIIRKHPGGATSTGNKKPLLERIRGKNLVHIINALEDKLTCLLGRKRDIISLEEL